MSKKQEYVHYVMGLKDALASPPYPTVHVNRKGECPLPDFSFKTNITSALCAIHTEISPLMVTVTNDCECLLEF